MSWISAAQRSRPASAAGQVELVGEQVAEQPDPLAVAAGVRSCRPSAVTSASIVSAASCSVRSVAGQQAW